LPADTPKVPARTGRDGRGKVRLLSRDALDGRTKARKQFDAIASGIAADLGGEDRLSTVQKHLVEAFAGCALTLNDINARALLGEPVDLLAYSQLMSLVRQERRIGAVRNIPALPPRADVRADIVEPPVSAISDICSAAN
jgi:hypothetical protein